MNGFSSKTTGWLGLTTGITSIIGATLLFIFLTGYFSNQYQMQKYGTYSDIAGIFPPIFSTILATTLYFAQRSSPPKPGFLHLAGVWTGTALILYAAWLIVSGSGGLVKQGAYHSFGYGLIGLWLLSLNSNAGKKEILPALLVRLGLVSSSFMLVGLLGLYGIVLNLDGDAPTTFLAVTGGISFIGQGILYPIWSILLGRWILSNQRDHDALE